MISASGGFPYWWGFVHVFRYSKGVWAHEAELTAPVQQFRAFFGRSIAIDGNTLVLGARGDDDDGGAVYVFRRAGGVWAQEARVAAPDREPGWTYYFGESVAIDGETMVIGALHGAPEEQRVGICIHAKGRSVDPTGGGCTIPDGVPGDGFGQLRCARR